MIIAHIYSEFPIGNTLDIKMRQSAGLELEFVSISESADASEIHLDASTVKLGDYTLTLESYDDAGGVYSTLKTDTIVITVSAQTQSVIPEVLPEKELRAGTKESWALFTDSVALQDYTAAIITV